MSVVYKSVDKQQYNDEPLVKENVPKLNIQNLVMVLEFDWISLVVVLFSDFTTGQ